MKDIKDYLHLYLGCEIEHDKKVYRGTLVSIGFHTAEIHCDFFKKNSHGHRVPKDKDFGTFHIQICRLKPILRPLSDMTDAEFKELIMLEWGVNRDIVEQKIKTVVKSKEVKHAVKYGTSIPFRAFDESGNHVMTGTISSESLNPEQFQYILSKGFDLFGLIEAGLAIDLTKLNKEK